MAAESVARNVRRVTLQETANLYRLKRGQTPSTPSLTLRGQWLAKAGFQAGQCVTVVVEADRLIITTER